MSSSSSARHGHGRSGHLAHGPDPGDSSGVILRRRGKQRQLDEVLEVLHGIGMMLMDISARLETVVELMKGDNGERESDT